MTEPAVVAVAFFPLSRAMICLETDETIFDRDFKTCPACGSVQVMPLAKWLGTVNAEPYDAVFPNIEAWALARRI
jgi:hypothetical protein